MMEPPLLAQLRKARALLGNAGKTQAGFQQALQAVARNNDLCPACLGGKGTVGGPLAPRTCPICKGKGTFQAGSSSYHG